MVWRNAREELYSAVARNNSAVLTPPDAAVVVKREPPAPQYSSGGNAPRNAPQNAGGNAPHTAPQNAGGNAPHTAPQPPADPFRALLSDRDALILIALILLLLHEKADIKLIGALAFVLLA